MRSFLKWAGGKYNLLSQIKEVLPEGNRLIEPFLGAGSVFLNTDFQKYLLADTNQDLINVFQYIQKEGSSFIESCASYFVPCNNQKEKYNQLRDQFNQSQDNAEKARLFIYLNRHAYNGLCRYRSDGYFNVPFGSYANPKLPKALMMNFHEKSREAHFICQDFLTTLSLAKKGDVIYCDPPYIPLSNTANFTTYHAIPFSHADQIKLAKAAEQLKRRKISVIISNHDTDSSRALYKKARKIISFEVQRHISSNGAKREKVRELLAIY